MDWNFVIEVGKVVGAVGVVSAAVWKIAPKIWSALKGWMMQDIHAQICQMSKDITYIVSEVRTNGGTSIKDALVRNEQALARIEAMSHSNVEIQKARMDNDPQLIFITDSEGNCLWVNRSYSRLSGRGIDELKGSGWINVITPDEREEVKELWYEAAESNREFEMRVTYQDTLGKKFQVDIRSYKMTSPNGETTGYMGAGALVGDHDR